MFLEDPSFVFPSVFKTGALCFVFVLIPGRAGLAGPLTTPGLSGERPKKGVKWSRGMRSNLVNSMKCLEKK